MRSGYRVRVGPSRRLGWFGVGRLRAAGLAVLLASGLGCGGGREREQGRPDPASRRVTRTGEVVGFVGRYGGHVWLSIPFAKPPTGQLRWRAPVAPEPWPGTREALAFGSPCTQYASPIGGVASARLGEPVGSEDCLYLNVYAPRLAAAEVPTDAARLPVMVWIHGGGNSIGEAGFYNGGNLAAARDVVVITINYRLGPFGWFRHLALRGDGTSETDRSGNFGTLDLLRALEWVQENVTTFGGDPGNVTIFGESAGGVNVFTLLLSPRASGLFHRAIVQSGGLRLGDVARAENRTDDATAGHANSSGEALLRLLIADGRARDRAEAKGHLARMSGTGVERYLRAKRNVEILSAYAPMPGLGMIDMPLVFRDGVVLPDEDPMARFARADGYNRLPVMLGTTRDENKLFLFTDPKRVRRWFWVIPRLRDERHYQLSAEYLAKTWKASGADEPAAAMRATQGPSVFVYRFDWDEEPTILGADLSVMLGAAHGFEIPFVFGHFDLGREGNVIFTDDNAAGREELSARMMSYWTEFASHGAPGRGRDGQLPAWTAWDDRTPAGSRFIILDTAAGGGVRMSNEAVTVASVIAAVDADPRLPTQREKCMIFRELAKWSRGFTEEDYPKAGRLGCADYPYDAYPWT